MPLRACLEAGFESEKSQFFDETVCAVHEVSGRRLFEERTHRYGQKKQRRVIKKVAFAAQSLASKHTLTNNSHFISIEFPRIICAKFPNNYLGKGEDSDLLRVGPENLRSFRKLYCR